MKKKVLLLPVLVLVLALAFCATGCKGEPDEAETGDLEFILAENGGSYSVRGKTSSKLTATEIEIPATYDGVPVTTIAQNGFSGFTKLTSITLPEGISVIGQRAFQGDTALSSVTLPNTVTTVTREAFKNCSHLKTVTLGNATKRIGNAAFSECTALESITFPATVESIEEKAFEKCSSLAEVKLPEGLKTIGGYAFSFCPALESVKIPAGIETVGEWSFAYNNGRAGEEYEAGNMLSIYFYGDVCENFGTQILGYTWDAEGFSVYVPTEFEDSYNSVTESNWVRCVVEPGLIKPFDPTTNPF